MTHTYQLKAAMLNHLLDYVGSEDTTAGLQVAFGDHRSFGAELNRMLTSGLIRVRFQSTSSGCDVVVKITPAGRAWLKKNARTNY